jgi:hypothetical protein
MAGRVGVEAGLASATDRLNAELTDWLASLITARINPDMEVVVLGLAYKPGTSVVERAASVSLIRTLLDAGVTVAAHDPMAELPEDLVGRVRMLRTAREAFTPSSAVVLVTPWPEYDELFSEVERHVQQGAPFIDCWRRFSAEPLIVSEPAYCVVGIGPASSTALTGRDSSFDRRSFMNIEVMRESSGEGVVDELETSAGSTPDAVPTAS